MKERENKRKNLLLVNRSFHLRWMIIRLFFRCGAVVADYGNISLALMDGLMTVTVTKLKQKRLSQKRTDADATRPDAKPFRSVFVRANSEHMSKVMRLAKG